jgi:hypothetical protein
MKTNDIVSITSYTRVVGVGNNLVTVMDLDSNIQYDINGKTLIDKLMSADEFHTEISLPKTEIASILVNAWNKPFTVEFRKQNGNIRILRGRLISTEPLLGRSMVEDLDKEGERTRLVDHRTLISLILEGVKYIVKL